MDSSQDVHFSFGGNYGNDVATCDMELDYGHFFSQKKPQFRDFLENLAF